MSTSQQPARPWQLWICIICVGLEAVGMAVLAVTAIVFSFSAEKSIVAGQQADLGSALLGLGVMFAIFALGLVGVALGLLRYRRWARPAIVAFQILLAIFGVTVGSANALVAAAAIVPAVVILLFLLMPATVRAYEAGIAAGTP